MTDEELGKLLENAAEKGAERAIEKLTHDVYEMVGKKVLGKVLQTIGVLIVGFVVWAIQHGWFK